MPIGVFTGVWPQNKGAPINWQIGAPGGGGKKGRHGKSPKTPTKTPKGKGPPLFFTFLLKTKGGTLTLGLF